MIEQRHIEAGADLLQAITPTMSRRRALRRAALELATPQTDTTVAHAWATRTGRFGEGVAA